MSEQVYTLKDSILKLESDISDKVFSNQASQAVGFAAGGLRTTVLFSERAENLLSSIRMAADLHLPIVFWVPENIQDMISGAIIWSLVDEEQLMATALMAHRSAELALMPAVIMYPHTLKIDSLLDFNKNTALQFLKTSAAAEKSPTPAQEFLFGENRPLNINWIDLNHPRLLNPVQNSKERYLRWASETTFFRSHVPEILDSVRKEYNKAFIEPFEWFDFVPGKKSKSVIYCSDSTFSEIKEVQVSNQGASTYPGILHAKLVSPFPSEDFARLLPPSSEVSWAMKQGNRVNNLQNSPPFTRMGSNWHKIVLNDEVLSEGKDAMDSLLEAASKGDLSEVNFSGVTFTGIETGQPRKEILIDFIKEHYPHYAEKKKNRETKHVFSVFSSESPRLRKLNIEQKGVLGLADYIPYILEDYDEKGLAQNWAHPLRAINSTPGAASLASDWSDSRQQFPVWSPSACTTCGSCFDQCPAAALTPASFNWESFLTSAQVLCDEKGFNVSKIRPLIKPLASALSTVTASAEGNVSEFRVSDFLPNALEQVFEKMQPEDQKKKEIEEAVGYILAEVGTLKVAVGDLLFNELESYQKGTGELLHIEFDPHACTGCGLCAESCNENAIVMTSVKELRELDLASFPQVEKFQNTQSD
ncbi:MAG: 4Fe-4S binding protein, partial [Cyclobacteriaceae bacterium]|nr:4Fe-4S binding protein [Cyclobacteriaceae bacterium]